MTQAATLLGLQIGDYQLVEFLGAGGMGDVYRAVHTRLNRSVAVKVLHRTRGNATFVERFRNEARIQADLKHPNIVTLYDFVEYEGRLCIIMEYVDGASLDTRIREAGRLPAEEALAVFRSVVEALAYTHRQGVVHRDIKPHNVKIGRRGEVKLLDFGIAKGEATPGLTAAGAVVGTPEYLSPEQLRGKPADPRSDVWALGVLLYEMLTGRIPFEASSLIDLYKKIDEADYTRPSALAAGVSPALEAIVARCLQRRPANRYQSAEELLQDVQRCAEGQATPARPTALARLLARLKTSRSSQPRPRRFAASIERNWQLYLVGLASVLLIVVAIAVRPLIQGRASNNGGPVDPSGPTQPGGPEHASGPAHTIMIDVIGAPADVYRAGRRVGTTSYSLKTWIGERVELTLRRDGYHDTTMVFEVTANTRGYTGILRRKR